MADLFHDKAADWDTRPTPVQISEGVCTAILERVPLDQSLTLLDFGAGTGLVAGKLAGHVGHVIAVDVSQAMLDQLARKPELSGKVEIRCQDLLEAPLEHPVDLVVSAMAMHHVENTPAVLAVFFDHLRPGGRVALADLDAEDGSFHGPSVPGVFHNGFSRDALAGLLTDAGFVNVTISTACEITKDSRPYTVFLACASKPAA